MRNEDLHNLYMSDIIRMIKSRRMRRPRYVARIGQMRHAQNNLVGRLTRLLGGPRRWTEGRFKRSGQWPVPVLWGTQ